MAYLIVASVSLIEPLAFISSQTEQNKAPGIDKVVKLLYHPTVRHLLAVVSNDFGRGVVRLVDTSDGRVVSQVDVGMHTTMGSGVSLIYYFLLRGWS